MWRFKFKRLPEMQTRPRFTIRVEPQENQENNNMTTEQSRREFEEWVVDYYHESSTMKYDNGDYINVEAVVAWKAWQAARDEKTAARILLPRLQRQASKLRKSSHHNALHDLHIIECAISTLEEIDNPPNNKM